MAKEPMVLPQGELHSFQIWRDRSSEKLHLDIVQTGAERQISMRYQLSDDTAKELLRQIAVHLAEKGIVTVSLDAPNPLQ